MENIPAHKRRGWNYDRASERERQAWWDDNERTKEIQHRMQADLDRRIANFTYKYSS
jgi:hypothetical protein